jgi:hypothetical protein
LPTHGSPTGSVAKINGLGACHVTQRAFCRAVAIKAFIGQADAAVNVQFCGGISDADTGTARGIVNIGTAQSPKASGTDGLPVRAVAIFELSIGGEPFQGAG